ncbi:head maturation protease, ClpP-related [Bacteroides thetaiotaomicron]|uniref:head maturation protease, ClpP-related n=1 Tax=Bacteroides TaxID=816 RepID=UPI001896D388|nr:MULTISPECIES: head maturation protease, ClpP-related [Bacteroides]MCS3231767.1 Clp protease ClpP [Bacteroides thetaiotaomicron]MDD3228276.1 Clp protease ClpP [Oscillospiraceae bacterium]MBT9921321.1 Clp protease ClpP [Bacteroides uniformis]MDC2622326.1 Clp protease ClpP [Bacteroides ovatus]MDC2635350.1 Clp protease ClpP [Bacteroides ovatus]
MNKFFNMIPGREACCILLYGDIGDYDDVRSGDIARELLEAESAYGKIDVRINSNGGDVYAGIAIFNALKNSKADITIYIDGIAASMASVIALCGKPVQMSRYSRLMLHSVMGGCYGNKDEMRRCIAEIESLEDTLCEMYATRLGKGKDEIRSTYFDGTDHWLRADEALALGFIDGIYDADPVPEDSTPDQVYQIFNNRLNKPQNEEQMNLDELKKRPHFKNCASDEDFLREIGVLETEAGKVPGLNTEVNRLTGELKVFQDKAKADEENSRKKLLDDAQEDGRIDATTRPIYENLLVKDRENGEKALEKLAPKRKVMNDLHVNPTDESPWNKRQREIKEKLNRK